MVADGINARALLAQRRDIPSGLLASHASRWINGIIKTAPAHHVEYVLGLWETLPDDAGRVDQAGAPIARPGRRHPKPGEDWITITDDMREALRGGMTAKGLTVRQLAECEGAPPDLSRRMINAWLYGDSLTGRKKLWDLIMSSLADKTK